MNEPKQYKRGDVREDGYVFQRYQFNGTYNKAYEVWMSPLALKVERDRKTKWRLNNKEKALEARRAWYRKRKEASAPEIEL
jgi:hypothetical protein